MMCSLDIILLYLPFCKSFFAVFLPKRENLPFVYFTAQNFREVRTYLRIDFLPFL